MVFAYINGNFVPREQAVIPIDDRGFRFGDGVFETIRICHTIPYQWEAHLARLKAGLDALQIDFSIGKLQEIATDLIRRNGAEDGFLRIMVTRGSGSQGYLPKPEAGSGPTLVMETTDYTPPPEKPVSLWVSESLKVSSRALPLQAKLMQGVNSILARLEAQQHECFESLLLGDRAQICECSSSNIFWFSDKTLFTPSIRAGILPGTTREAVIRLSPYKVKEGLFFLKELDSAEEVFITNVAWGVLPVGRLYPMEKSWDEHPVATKLQALLLKDMSCTQRSSNG